MPISNTLTMSSLGKTLPSKVLSGVAVEVQPSDGWLYDDGTGDPWWQGAGGSPYRWKLTADIASVQHGSHLTRLPFYYTGVDITPNMWVMSVDEPKALRVIQIINRTDSNISCIVEDVDRYNIFKDPTGSGVGIFQIPTNLIFFELGDDGLPILDPIPETASNHRIVSSIEARFRVSNPLIENLFFQLHHNFTEGQVLKINKSTGLFENAGSDDIHIVGTVVKTGPGPNYFYLSPSTKLILNLAPALPGNVGDVIYLDSLTGGLTTNQGGVPVYIKMTTEVPSYTIGTVDLPITGGGNIIKLNNTNITFNDGSATDIIDSINALTLNHGVIASMSAPLNEITSAGSYPSTTMPASGHFKFKLNGVIIDITGPSINYGDSGDIGFWDIIRSINEQTASHGVTAKIDFSLGGVLVFTNHSAGDIDITNVEPITSVDNIKTMTDMLGVSSVNPPTTSTRLKLSRADGGAITLSDISGQFTTDVGIQGSANGSLPIALVVDKTMSATSSGQIVVDLPALNAITSPRSGDQVYVQNGKTPGEWELYVRTGATWALIADHDSAKTDASTMTVEVSKTSPASVSLGNMSNGTRIVNVTVVVSEAFSSAASLNVGTDDAIDVVLNDDIIDLSIVGSYESNTTYIYSGVADGELFVHLDSASSTSGKAKVIVSYL